MRGLVKAGEVVNLDQDILKYSICLGSVLHALAILFCIPFNMGGP